MADDFTYWANLSTDTELGVERLKGITSWIEGQIRAFVGTLQDRGIKYVEYHIFPFDTRSISIFFGDPDSAEYFSLSLEDLDISESSIVIRRIRISKWMGFYERKLVGEPIVRDIDATIWIRGNGLFNFLVAIYNDPIAKTYNLPIIQIS